MKSRFRLFAAMLVFALIPLGAFSQEVTVYGLEAMPYCGLSEGKPVGIVIDILTQAKKYGAPQFKFVLDEPWSRAQDQVLQAKSDLVAIIPFSRTPQREKSYMWMAELFQTQYRLYSFKRAAPLASLDEAKAETVGVVHGHAILPVLKNLGFAKIDDGASNAEGNAAKLFSGRYGIIAESDIISLYNWKMIRQDSKTLQVGPAIGDPTHVFIAANPAFPPDVAKKISDALKKMQQNGEIQKILDTWK
jgi:polar amino acid transport system substrate-binding protein